MPVADPAATLPHGLGPYRVLGVLGQGGMGVVYRGAHRGSGEAVAIKTVRAPSEALIATLRREIRALSRVQHPGVVRVLDEGVEAGLPWYAMPLLSGRTLRQRLAARWAADAEEGDTYTIDRDSGTSTGARDSSTATSVRRPDAGAAPAPHAPPAHARVTAPPLGPALTLLRRLCAPLAHLHGAGLVHRDLKPDNVFLLDGDRPVLVDLGIAAGFGGALGREELAAEGRVMGTVSYMAPEQIRGELVDARADLYALGCMLYEVATGKPPFTGANASTVLYQHLHQAPAPPSERAAGVPEALDRLALTLLAKRPQDRLGYAEDVAAALDALGAEADPEEGPRPRAYLYRPDLVGRGRALRALGDAIHRLHVEGRGGVTLLGGESGAGKTRLAMEAARLAVQRDLTVITGECAALGAGRAGGAPLHPLRPLLLAVADRARAGGASAADRLLGPRGKVLAAYEPALLDLPGQREQPDPPALPPEAARARVLAALGETLSALAASARVVLVLDDLQWADDLSLSFLRALAAPGAAARGALVVGTYRAEEATDEIEALARAEGVEAIPVGRLDAGSVAQMAAGMLALREPPEGFFGALVGRSSGNPFFVAEYLRAAIGEGMLSRDRGGRWRFHAPGGAAASLAALPLPQTLAELIDRRLDGLGAEARALAAWGAVLGREVDGELLAAGSGGAEAEAMELVDALRARQILEEAGAGRLRFVHDKIREIAYARIPEGERRRLHLRAGEAIEARHGEAAELLPALGHHFARAGVHGKAARYHGLAAERARATYANGEAVAAYRGAIEALDALAEGGEAHGEARARAQEGLGDVLALMGRQEEAREAHEEALRGAAAEARMERARLHRKIGKTWERRHAHEAAMLAYRAAEEALGEAPAEGAEAWWGEWMHAQIDRISVHYWLAQVEPMARLVEEVRPAVEAHGTPRQRARFFQALTQMHVQMERSLTSARTVEYARACLAASDASGDEGEVATARFGLGVVLLWHGELEGAEAELLATLRAAGRIGDAPLRARCLTYLTMVQRRRRAAPETRALAQRALEVAEAIRMVEYVGAARANLAWAALREGDRAAAEQEARAALSLWQPLALVFPFQWLARLPLARVALDAGRLEEAAAEARALLEPKQQRLPEAIASALEAALGALGRGRASHAKARLHRALRAAEAHGYL